MGVGKGMEHTSMLLSTVNIHFIASPKSDIKPYVDEIIATEETPDAKEIPRVEKEKNTKSNQQTAKKTHGKAAAARTVP